MQCHVQPYVATKRHVPTPEKANHQRSRMQNRFKSLTEFRRTYERSRDRRRCLQLSREPHKEGGKREEQKMMNVLALGLLVSTFAAAGIWSPNPHQGHERHPNNVVLKEGHRVIVVEYEREGLQKPTADSSAEAASRMTKNLESPHGLFEEAKEKFKEAAADLPNLGQGVSGPVGGGSKEKICDVFGRCKEKISVVYSKAKELLSDGVSRAEGVGKEAVENVRHGGEAVAEKAKEGMRSAAHGEEAVVEKTKEAAENLARGGEDIVEKAKETAGNVIHGGEKAIDKAKEAAENVIHGGERVAENVAEKAKHGGEKVAEALKSFREEAEHVKEKAFEEAKGKAKQHQETAEKALEKSKHDFEEPNVTRVGLARDRERRKVMDAAAAYRAVMSATFSPETSRLLMWIVHLLSFSITYGVCVWTTFVSSYMLGRVLPRQQFAVVQSKIYPVYFMVVACGIGFCVLSFFFSQEHGRRRGDGLAKTLLCYNLLASLGLVLVNMLYLEPRATKVMYERLKLEKEEGNGRDIDDTVAAADPGETTTTARKISTGFAAGNGGVNATTFTATATAAAGSTAQREAVKRRAVELSKRLMKLNTNSSFLNVMTLMSLTWHLVYLAKIFHTAC